MSIWKEAKCCGFAETPIVGDGKSVTNGVNEILITRSKRAQHGGPNDAQFIRLDENVVAAQLMEDSKIRFVVGDKAQSGGVMKARLTEFINSQLLGKVWFLIKIFKILFWCCGGLFLKERPDF